MNVQTVVGAVALHAFVVQSVGAIRDYTPFGDHPLMKTSIAEFLLGQYDHFGSSVIYLISLIVVASSTPTVIALTGALTQFF